MKRISITAKEEELIRAALALWESNACHDPEDGEGDVSYESTIRLEPAKDSLLRKLGAQSN